MAINCAAMRGNTAKYVAAGRLALLLGIPVLSGQPLLAGEADLVRTGSLLCTTSAEVQDETTISCSYNGIAGGDGQLAGTITIKGEAGLAPGRRVLMWSVLAPNSDMRWNQLVGHFRETTPGQLSGGKDGKILLVPATDTVRSHDGAITVLKLSLIPQEQQK